MSQWAVLQSSSACTLTFPVCLCPGTAIVTKYPKLGALNNRNVSSHDSGGQKSKIKVSLELVSSEGCGGESVPGLPPSF